MELRACRHMVLAPGVFGAAALAVALASAGCAERAQLSPAPGANVVPGMPNVATAAVNGVDVRVEAQAWPGPESIKREVMPLKVAIVNSATHPVAIRYEHVYLTTPAGQRFYALPAFHAQREAVEALPEPGVATLGFTHDGFFVAPHLHPYFPHLAPFGHAFAYDTVYYDRYFDYWERRNLARDQVRLHAIPEGVIEPGGRVAGFFYFEDVPEDEVSRVTFHADLMNPNTGQEVARVSVPFILSEAD